MPDVKPSLRLELGNEAIDQRRLGGTVEIDHDVAAEDGVEQSAERPRLQQIELVKADQRPQFVIHDDGRRTRVFFVWLHQVAIRRRHFLQRRVRVFTLFCLGQHVGIDIGRQNSRIMVTDLRHLALQHHGNAVRLLAGRATGRPDPKTATRLGLLGPRECLRDVGLKVIEMMRFAEELGQIRRDRVDESFDLAFTLRRPEKLSIIPE